MSNWIKLFDKIKSAGPTDAASQDRLVEKTDLEQVLHYHRATKHHFYAFAAGPGYLDWETQPDPFRRYRGAPLLELERLPPGNTPEYEPAFRPGQVAPAPLNRRSISQLFYDSLALSAWKRVGDVSWALRVNPSSGNLHPTEGYLVAGPIEGLSDTPLVGHYAPREHGLEVRARFPVDTWQALAAGLPPGALLVGLTSIHWRETWKYGERAFRYCQHDVGHAIAALSLAAAGLGWQARLLDGLGTGQIGTLLGVTDSGEAEAEHPDCLLAVCPQGAGEIPSTLPHQALDFFSESSLTWLGQPNRLSPDRVDWPIIERTAAAARKPFTPAQPGWVPAQPWPDIEAPPAGDGRPVSLRRLIRRRRSAVDMDGRTGISRARFYHILSKTLPRPDRFPFNTWPWPPAVHLVLFVHRVEDLPPGLYLLARDPAEEEALRAAFGREFAWDRPEGCPAGLPLYRLAAGDARAAAGQLSCQQRIAADGCFSLGMLANFEPALRLGAWFYPRLFWECGMIGQVLYLEAEAAGIRGTGIGCFFDDPVHDLLGLTDLQYQSLYHFTMGGPVEDTRLTTLPAYPE